MKRLLISVAVLGLLAGTSAYADNDHHHGKGQGQGQGQGGGGGGSAHGNASGNPQGSVVPGSNGIFDRAAGRTGSGGQGNAGQGGSSGTGHWQGNANSGNRGNANNWQGGNWQGNANNNWRGNNNRWRNNTWHGNNGVTITGRNWTSPRRFNAGAWRRPQGWYYRRWRFGEFLPAAFFLNAFWLTDFGAFDLPPPPPGLVWVRSGPDALLVDRYTGEIVQVVYGVFY